MAYSVYSPAMSVRATFLRLSAIRIALALAVAGVGLSFLGAAAHPNAVPTISVAAQVDDPFPSSVDAVTLTASADGPTGSTYTRRAILLLRPRFC